eukprot:40880-Prymnesium_polylepis.1
MFETVCCACGSKVVDTPCEVGEDRVEVAGLLDTAMSSKGSIADGRQLVCKVSASSPVSNTKRKRQLWGGVANAAADNAITVAPAEDKNMCQQEERHDFVCGSILCTGCLPAKARRHPADPFIGHPLKQPHIEADFLCTRGRNL